MSKQEYIPQIGDKVRFKGRGIMLGIITADDKSWHVVKDCYDISPKNSIGHIVSRENILEVIKKQCVPAKYIHELYGKRSRI